MINKHLNIHIQNRPWGNMIRFCLNAPDITVKVLTVNPKEVISLQKHKYRDQFYYIIDELTIITENKQEDLVESIGKPGDEFYFHRGTLHRAYNHSLHPARYLEISFGNYNEKDIKRIEDKYGRK